MGGSLFSSIPIIGGNSRGKKVSLYADLREGSISNRMFIGDAEIFKVHKEEPSIRTYVYNLMGKGDMEVLLSQEYAEICRRMLEDPERTIGELRKISEETAESKEVVKKILRRLSHSQDEVIRTYAFNEL